PAATNTRNTSGMSESTIYQLKALTVLSAIALFLAFLGWKLGEGPGLTIAIAVAVFCAFAAYWSADKRVLRMHRAVKIQEEHAPGLCQMVRELARRTDLPVPGMYLIPDAAANAFATGRNVRHGSIAVSSGLLDLLDREELAAVIAHEFGHIRRGDTLFMTVLAAFAGIFTSISNFFTWSNLLGTSTSKVEKRDGVPSDAFFWILIAPIAALLIRLATSGSREYCADEHSARLIGDSSPLASALLKIDAQKSRTCLESASPASAHLFICSPLSAKGSMRLFQTHPPVTKRIEKLEAFARRPAVPSSWVGVL